MPTVSRSLQQPPLSRRGRHVHVNTDEPVLFIKTNRVPARDMCADDKERQLSSSVHGVLVTSGTLLFLALVYLSVALARVLHVIHD